MLNLKAHIITVEADEAELARTALSMEVLKPLSASNVNSLADLKIETLSEKTDAPTIVRLFGKSHTQALVWLGSGGRVASEAAILGFADGIVVEPGQPPRAVSVLPSAFVSAVATEKISYDSSGAGILIGACDEARAVAASFSRLGFKRLMIVDPDDGQTESMVQILRRRLFGVEIQAVERGSLTQVPSEAAMAINLVSAQESSLLEDVSYLNFLKKSGVWIDWTGATYVKGFAEEITNAGAMIFGPEMIRAWREVWLLRSIPNLLETTGQKPEVVAEALRTAWEETARNALTPTDG